MATHTGVRFHRTWAGRSRILALLLVPAMLLAGCAGSNKDKIRALAGEAPGAASPQSAELASPAPGTETSGAPAEAEGAGETAVTAPIPGTASAAPTTPAPKPATAAAKPGAPAARPGAPAAPAKPGAASAASPAPSASRGDPGAATPATPVAPQPQPGPAPGATEVGVSDDEIKVGFISELSGPIAVYGQSFAKATQAYFRHINDQGGVNGRKFKVILYDDAWDPVRGKAAAKRLVEQDKVFALCCTQSLNTNAAITPYLDEVRVPNVGPDGLNDEQYKGAYTFPIGTASVPLGNLMGNFVPDRLGAKAAALIIENVSGGKQFGDAFRKNFEAKGGKVVFTQNVNPDEADLTPFVLQARAQGAELIVGHIDVVVAIRLLQAAQTQGWKPPKNFAFGTGVYLNIFPQYVGSFADGTVVMNHALPWEVDSPGLREFNDIVGRYYDLKDLNYSPWLALSVVSARLFVDGVRTLGRDGVTREGLKNWLDNLTNWDTGWGLGVTFRPGNHVANRYGLFLQVKEGKFVPLTELLEDTTYKG